MKSALVFSNVQLWEFHHAEVIELVWRLTKEGRQVYLISCDGQLDSCPANSKHSLIKCSACRLVTRRTEKFFLPPGCKTLRLSLEKNNFNFPIKDLNDLLILNFNNLPIGKLVASQIADDLNGVYINPEHVESKIAKLINSGIALYLKTIELIEDLCIDEVFTWNGRRPSDGAPLYAAQFKNIKFSTFISGGKVNNLHIAKDTSVQEVKVIKNEIDLYRKSKQNEEIRASGRQHFLSDIHVGINQIGFQVFNPMSVRPRELKTSKPILLVVTSSPTESIHMNEHYSFYGDSPYEILMSILNSVVLTGKYQVVVRWHPAKVKTYYRDQMMIKRLIEMNEKIIHISPEDSDDTYELLTKAEVVLSFGSTVGYVATLMGKPTILAGPMASLFKEAFYCAHKPSDIYDYLLSDLRPKNAEEVEYYGYYCSNFGNKMKFVEVKRSVDNTYRGFFQGEKGILEQIPIHPPFFRRFQNVRIRNFLQLLWTLKS